MPRRIGAAECPSDLFGNRINVLRRGRRDPRILFQRVSGPTHRVQRRNSLIEIDPDTTGLTGSVHHLAQQLCQGRPLRRIGLHGNGNGDLAGISAHRHADPLGRRPDDGVLLLTQGNPHPYASLLTRQSSPTTPLSLSMPSTTALPPLPKTGTFVTTHRHLTPALGVEELCSSPLRTAPGPKPVSVTYAITCPSVGGARRMTYVLRTDTPTQPSPPSPERRGYLLAMDTDEFVIRLSATRP